ncbi:MAG: cyclohexanone monooxygenase [Piscirickettsiaceae bacterium]|nr:MAG: cyclohexanone monooxygenase [Piscirickettsiaceae bacterium]
MNTGNKVVSIKKVDAFIVGAGFAGLYMLHLLRDQQNLDVVVVDLAGGVGGTWYWNRYPGARCDVASHAYSFSFSDELQQEWQWSEKFAAQPEILSYLEHVAERFDLNKNIQLNTTVKSVIYDETDKRWDIVTTDGQQFSAQYFIPATGALSSANIPLIAGQDLFKGEVYVTGKWPAENVDFKGKKVAIIGTGATAIQVIPVVAEQCEHLTVFQRTANYTCPLRNEPMTSAEQQQIKENYDERREAERHSFAGMIFEGIRPEALADSPEERDAHYQKLWDTKGFGIWFASYEDILYDKAANKTAADFFRKKIRECVDDPKVANLLCPSEDQLFGIKRQPCDTGYLEAFNRDNVSLVDIKHAPIKALTAQGLMTETEEYEFDILIYATGFDAFTGSLYKMGITGRNGLSLQEYWSAGPRTYLGLTVYGFPNMFTITGPQSPSVLSNMPVSIECHCEWIAACIEQMNKQKVLEIEAELVYENNWVKDTVELADTTLFPQGSSWYMGSNVPGKPRVFMVYVGGCGHYRETIFDIANKGYEGFKLT